MKENKNNQEKEPLKTENTENDNEMKSGKNDSPDYNGVGANEENRAIDENPPKAPQTSDKPVAEPPETWKNYTDEPISGATEA